MQRSNKSWPCTLVLGVRKLCFANLKRSVGILLVPDLRQTRAPLTNLFVHREEMSQPHFMFTDDSDELQNVLRLDVLSEFQELAHAPTQNDALLHATQVSVIAA